MGIANQCESLTLGKHFSHRQLSVVGESLGEGDVMAYEEARRGGIRLQVLIVEMSTLDCVTFRRVQLVRAHREVAQSGAMRGVAQLAVLLTAHLVAV